MRTVTPPPLSYDDAPTVGAMRPSSSVPSPSQRRAPTMSEADDECVRAAVRAAMPLHPNAAAILRALLVDDTVRVRMLLLEGVVEAVLRSRDTPAARRLLLQRRERQAAGATQDKDAGRLTLPPIDNPPRRPFAASPAFNLFRGTLDVTDAAVTALVSGEAESGQWPKTLRSLCTYGPRPTTAADAAADTTTVAAPSPDRRTDRNVVNASFSFARMAQALQEVEREESNALTPSPSDVGWPDGDDATLLPLLERCDIRHVVGTVPVAAGGRLVVHVAAANGAYGVVALCCDAELGISRASVSAPLTEAPYWTPLHLAAFNGDFRVVQLLRHGGADLLAKDKYGDTPADVAAAAGHMRVALQLRDEMRANAEAERKLAVRTHAAAAVEAEMARARAAELQAQEAAQREQRDLELAARRAERELRDRQVEERQRCEREALQRGFVSARERVARTAVLAIEAASYAFVSAVSSVLFERAAAAERQRTEVAAAAAEEISRKKKKGGGARRASQASRLSGQAVKQGAAATPALTRSVSSVAPSVGTQRTAVASSMVRSQTPGADTSPEPNPRFTSKQQKAAAARERARLREAARVAEEAAAAEVARLQRELDAVTDEEPRARAALQGEFIAACASLWGLSEGCDASHGGVFETVAAPGEYWPRGMWTCCGGQRWWCPGCVPKLETALVPRHTGTLHFHADGCTCVRTRSSAALEAGPLSSNPSLRLNRSVKSIIMARSFLARATQSRNGGRSGRPITGPAGMLANMAVAQSSSSSSDTDGDGGDGDGGARLNWSLDMGPRFCRPGMVAWTCCGSRDLTAFSAGCARPGRFEGREGAAQQTCLSFVTASAAVELSSPLPEPYYVRLPKGVLRLGGTTAAHSVAVSQTRAAGVDPHAITRCTVFAVPALLAPPLSNRDVHRDDDMQLPETQIVGAAPLPRRRRSSSHSSGSSSDSGSVHRSSSSVAGLDSSSLPDAGLGSTATGAGAGLDKTFTVGSSGTPPLRPTPITPLVLCCEITIDACPAPIHETSERMVVGVALRGGHASGAWGPGKFLSGPFGIGWWAHSTHIRGLGVTADANCSYGPGDVVTVALDPRNRALHFFRNRRLAATIDLPWLDQAVDAAARAAAKERRRYQTSHNGGHSAGSRVDAASGEESPHAALPADTPEARFRSGEEYGTRADASSEEPTQAATWWLGLLRPAVTLVAGCRVSLAASRRTLERVPRGETATPAPSLAPNDSSLAVFDDLRREDNMLDVSCRAPRWADPRPLDEILPAVLPQSVYCAAAPYVDSTLINVATALRRLRQCWDATGYFALGLPRDRIASHIIEGANTRRPASIMLSGFDSGVASRLMSPALRSPTVASWW